MTERLDRIEAAVERNAASISTLMGAFESNSDRMSQILVILQQDISDRREERIVMRQSITENRQKVSENESRFETLLAAARADRIEWQRQIAAQTERMERQQAEWQRQLAAQNRVIQEMLSRLMNHDERIDRLEAS